MYRDFEDNRWFKLDSKTFEFDVNEDVANARIIIKFSHVYEPYYNNVPIEVVIKKQGGESETIKTTMFLKDKKGKDISDCLGDICDLDFMLKENYPFRKGKYSITIANTVNTTYLPNVIGLGLEVERLPGE